MMSDNKQTSFFQPATNITKPYALMDLDDTLFQTQRKIEAWGLPTSETNQLVCASVNKQNEPLSFMTGRQQILFNWLLARTELIVVTARDTQEIKRVKLPFSSWQVLTHGAVILQPNGDVLPAWQRKMFAALQPLQAKIQALTTMVDTYNVAHGNLLKLAMHSDEFQYTENGNVNDNVNEGVSERVTDSTSQQLHIYLAVKHKQKDHQALRAFADWLLLEQPDLADDFYIHINANNLAILPHAVHKQYAVVFLLANFLDDTRPSFGFGDSLADLPFLQLLDWYGTPNHGQLHDKITS